MYVYAARVLCCQIEPYKIVYTALNIRRKRPPGKFINYTYNGRKKSALMVGLSKC